jgi:chemotaxis protein methyltransferase CheR
VRDEACVRFLQTQLPRIGLKWRGYRKVRRTVCKRVGRRLRELGLAELAAYEDLLARSPAERARLDAFCRIPISRFYRDRGVFDALAERLLPVLAERARQAGRDALRCWSAGCASGEEVYSLRLIWDLSLQARFPGLRLSILATDADEVMLARAAAACYPPGSLKEAPERWPRAAFIQGKDLLCLRPEFRRDIAFRRQDIRAAQPQGPFDLILCRNLVFTYFAEDLQRRLLAVLARRLEAGGLLVLGAHESLPADGAAFARAADSLPIWRRTPPSSA